MESRDLDGPGDRDFFLELLALAETARRMARVTTALATELGDSGSYLRKAGVIRRTMTAEIPNVRADVERAGIPANDLSNAAIEAWARRTFSVAETRRVWDGPWNDAEDLPQWFVDRTSSV